MIRILAGLAAIGILLAWPGQAEAAESHDSCTGFIDSLPATIATQGTWCLRNNLSTSIASGTAIRIGANNVTIDCNGFKIGGLAAGPGTETIGIHVSYRLNATVRNCAIRGFNRGIHLSGTGGGGHLIEDNTIDESRTSGISISNAPVPLSGTMSLPTRAFQRTPARTAQRWWPSTGSAVRWTSSTTPSMAW